MVKVPQQPLMIPAEHLAAASPAEREQYRLYLISEALARDEWQSLLPAMASQYATVPFADHHKTFWEWVWGIELDARPHPFVGIWSRGCGKFLKLSEVLPVPSGWTTINEVKIGDQVLDEKGQPCNVLGMSPIEVKPTYRVHFKGGSIVETSGDHLWRVMDRKTRRVMVSNHEVVLSDWASWVHYDRAVSVCSVNGCGRIMRGRGVKGSPLCAAHALRFDRYGDALGGPVMRKRYSLPYDGSQQGRGTFSARTITTEEMLNEGLSDGREWQFAIPVSGVWDLPEVELPIEPYLLGVWLGDGNSAGGAITQSYEDRDELMGYLGREWYEVPSSIRPDNKGRLMRVVGLTSELKLAGLLGNKHVPSIYLRSSVKQRLALLQGLMDTDGTSNRNVASFCNTNKQIAESVHELAVSLGYRASINEKRAKLYGRDMGPCWNVAISGACREVFRLERKRFKLSSEPMVINSSFHYITKIEKLEDSKVRCLVVDSPNHLFLVGRDAIPTHNSSSAEMAVMMLGARNKRQYALYVSETQEQADDHVANIAALLEGDNIAYAYPEIGERLVGKFGNPKGWRRNRIRAATGFTVDAIGLDSAARGIKLENMRPDFLCHKVGTVIYDGSWTGAVESHPGLLQIKESEGVEVKVWGLPDSEIVTNDHKYWVKKFASNLDMASQQDPGWGKAVDLSKEDFIGSPIDMSLMSFPEVETYSPGSFDGERDELGRIVGGGGKYVTSIPVEFTDPEWWWFFGLWWGDGHFAGKYQVGITIAHTEPHIQERVENLLARYDIKATTVDRPGCNQLLFSRAWMNRWLRTWRYEIEGKTHYGLKKPPYWVEKLPSEFQIPLMRGYVDSDGCTNNEETKIVSVSYDGLVSAKRILARLGISSTIRNLRPARTAVIKGIHCNTKRAYDLRFGRGQEVLGLIELPPSRFKFTRTFIEDGWVWHKIKSVESIGFEKFAPIDVGKDHTYLTDFGMSHNCLDDIDSEADSKLTTAKKIKTITRKLIPAGSRNCAILAIQNKVHNDSIFAMLADGRADFLRDREVSGPIPAIWNMEWEDINNSFNITGGTPSWPEGQGLETCQAMMNDMGLSAFLAECQHSTAPPSGGMFDHINWADIRVSQAEVPDMKRVVVWLDPAVTDTTQSDSQGIVCDGLGVDGLIYRLWCWEGRTAPLAAMKRAITIAIEYGADTVGIETDQGGDTWKSVYTLACEELRASSVLRGSAPRYAEKKAGAGHGAKATRAQRMLVDYERNKFRHVEGTISTLEVAMQRFPKVKPFDVVDASYYSWNDLSNGGRRPARTRSAAAISVGTYSPR